MSSKYFVFASPGDPVSKDFRGFPINPRELNKLCRWFGKRPDGRDGWVCALALALACCLALGASGCGSGLNGASFGLINVTPNAVNFGSVPVGKAVQNSVSVVNEASSPLVISQMSFTNANFSSATKEAFPVSIPAGGNHTFKVGFTPSAVTQYSGQATLMSDSSAVAEIPLEGQGTATGDISISTSALSFGSLTVNSSATQTITLTSTGTSALTINAATITGAGFSIVGNSLPVTLDPSQSVTLQVQFLPTATGAVAGQLTISSNAATGNTALVALSGSGATAAPSQTANPQLSVSTSSLGFGAVPLNSPMTESLTLTSTGTTPVTVNSAPVSGQEFTLVGGTLPVTLNPNQTTTLLVQFKPTIAGAATGKMTVSSNSVSGSTEVVSLSGTGTNSASPQLTVSSPSLNFGNVTVDTATTQSVTLTSTGTTAVTVNSAAISGAGFTILGGSLPITLNPNQSTTLHVQFSPSTTGAASGQITISSNSTTGATSVVSLSGTSVAALSPQLTVSSASLTFGSVTVNTPTTQSLTLSSTGTSAVTVSAAAITGAGFTIVGGSLPATLNPNQAVTLQVQFDPTTMGSATGQITINSNSSTNATMVVSLSGTSTAALSAQLSVSAASLSFGSVTVNTATTQSLTLTSTGTAPVTVSSATVTGAGFSLVGGGLPATLNPNQAVTLQVQFDPTVTGAAAGEITVNSDSSTGTTAVVSLSGTSTAALSPQLSVSAGSLSFGSVTVNAATTQSLTLTSTGTAAVTVNSAAITGAGFSIVGGSLPATLNPYQTVTLQVQFLPTVTGAATGQITIRSDSSTGTTTVVNLSGTSTAELSPQLSVSAASLSFGSVTVNTPTTQSLTLTSTGTSAVTVNSAAITGAGFTIAGGGLPVTLNPNETVTLQVQFLPTGTGTAVGQISISSNSSTGAATVVSLSGTSMAALSPQLTVSTARLSFGSVMVNTAMTQSLTLTSTGTSAVTVNSAAITGAGFTIVGGSLPVTLDPNQAVTLQVQFLPTATGAETGQITISSNSTTGSSSIVNLNGTGAAVLTPQLKVSAASLSFGSLTVNTSTTQSLTLTSTGTAAVTVNSAAIAGAGFTIAGGSLPVTLNPGQAVTLQVQFLPTANGIVTGTITISSNSSTGSTSVVSLSGTGTAALVPQLTVSAASLNFGSVTVNASTTQSLTLTSTGTAAVTVNSAAITGAGFTIVGGSLPVTLNPTATVTLQVQFLPAVTGAATGTITISSNSSTGSTTAVNLSGTSTAALSPQLTVSAASLSFGSVTVNTATTQSLALRSTGTSAVTVNSAAITGAGFTIVAASFPMTLNPGQSLTLQVQFDPAATGAASGQVTINSNSTSGSAAIVTLSGTGTGTNPQLTISSASVSFGSVADGTASTQSLTLTSTGTTPVTVNAATITGAGFTIIGAAFPITLNPSQSLTLQLQFEPTTAGALAGQLTINSNSSPGGTAIVGLSGTGTAVAHYVDLSWDAPVSSPDPVAGYNVYRLTGTGSFARINASPVSTVAYVDNNVTSGTSYSYQVMSVDSSGVESTPSNEITVTIP